jgi:hypothetical protein
VSRKRNDSLPKTRANDMLSRTPTSMCFEQGKALSGSWCVLAKRGLGLGYASAINPTHVEASVFNRTRQNPEADT